MFELGKREKEEIKGLLDESDTPNDFLNNLINYVYKKGCEDRMDEKGMLGGTE